MKKNTPDPIIKQLSDALKKELGQSIKDIILFGSRARGEILLRLRRIRMTPSNANDFFNLSP